MIFVDTNVFLRLLTEPLTSEDRTMQSQAANLFRDANAGLLELTTSDAVLGEVFFVLGGSVYNVASEMIARQLRPVLEIRGVKSASKTVWLHTLDTMEASPRMKFVDALGATYALEGGMELATFDVNLSRFPGVKPYAFIPQS